MKICQDSQSPSRDLHPGPSYYEACVPSTIQVLSVVKRIREEILHGGAVGFCRLNTE
jgi:hypothetical protein